MQSIFSFALAGILLFISCCGGLQQEEPILNLPPLPGDARGGAEIFRAIRPLDLEAREDTIYAEIARGNVPAWLRKLKRIEMPRNLDGHPHQVVFWVTPDYLAVGADDDYFLTPLSPQTAQRIADLIGASLPTTPMVDAIWTTAAVRLIPMPIPPGPQMTSVDTFEDHNRMVRTQRMRDDAAAGELVAGHKKDVVLTSRLDTLRGKVAIYGWHFPDGQPIQPLYTGHTDRWVDYSHGIRLVDRRVLIDGVRYDLIDVLRDTALAPLLNDNGVIAKPRYSRHAGNR